MDKLQPIQIASDVSTDIREHSNKCVSIKPKKTNHKHTESQLKLSCQTSGVKETV